MDTPTTLAPSAPILPKKGSPVIESNEGWEEEFVKLVWTMAETMRHQLPAIVAAMNKFRAKYGSEELDEMFAPKDSPPAPITKPDPLDSPNKPMK